MTVVLWVLFGLAGVSWAGLGLLLAYMWTMPPGGRAKAMCLSLASLWLVLLAIPLSLLGGGAGVWLAARLDTPGIRIVVGIAGGIMLAVVAAPAIGLWLARRGIRNDRSLQEEPPRLPAW